MTTTIIRFHPPSICTSSIFFISIGLLALLTSRIESASSCIKCTNCYEKYDTNSTTEMAVNCSSVNDTCIKSAVILPGATHIQKDCVRAESCFPKSLNIFGYGYSISCCFSDNCNAAAPTRSFQRRHHHLVISLIGIYLLLLPFAFI